uniref:NADH-ubiquinone oxidoreductase chain 4 n=1 Tax=Ornithodoros brasiliensis TaxID=888526 RepID=W0FGU1_ORNBR|nr:NADH dehydrogenase subunit 4 [Ornithodoros brasiliensis]AHF21686.1 NADH dehydrogenase subunit 4 [Ornithodoros brasiliensis]QZP40889.1 NADH dehydrogenase subunit 4 [Ornithodoros brasiliensis]
MLTLLMSIMWMMGMFMCYSSMEVILSMFLLEVFLFCQMDWSFSITNIGSFVGVDLMGFLLIQLSLFIVILMYMASMSLSIFNEGMFSFYSLLMAFLLVFCFSVYNLIGFYLFFESVLFPIVMLIVGWGNQPERLQAGLYMLFYTLGGSLPLLLFLLSNGNEFSISIFYAGWQSCKMGTLMFCMGILAFLVKMPMFMVHVWLPKAHVEAPVAGSMILAGVLLKLGIYGLLRVKIFFIDEMKNYGFVFMSIILMGGIFVSLICLCQVDVKALIAYSSVCHMGLSLGGVISMSSWGLTGNMLMMLGHGLCSSGLFCLANIYYERLYSRSLILLKGMGIFFPFLSVMWFLFSITNMAAPPSMNLGGEILLMGSMIKWSFLCLIPLGLMCFLSAAYSLYLYSYLNHGKGWVMYSVNMISFREMLLMVYHFIPLILWVFKMEFFMSWF